MTRGRPAQEQFAEAYRNLRLQWEQAKEDWNDPVQFRFETTHWLEIERESLRTLHAISSVAETLARIQRQLAQLE